MTTKRAFEIVLELAIGNSLTPREAGNDADLLAQVAEQNDAIYLISEIADRE